MRKIKGNCPSDLFHSDNSVNHTFKFYADVPEAKIIRKSLFTSHTRVKPFRLGYVSRGTENARLTETEWENFLQALHF